MKVASIRDISIIPAGVENEMIERLNGGFSLAMKAQRP